MAILALWATPRTVSTAFERMVIERGDHVVLDEPWSRAYYFGPERQSDRFPLVFPESTYAGVEAGVLAAGQRGPVFVKDMAYHAAPGIGDAALAAMTHTFLIRDPRSALVSLARRWPDFTSEEAGYAAQRHLFDRVVEVTGAVPAVVDSDVLRADPEQVVASWCRRAGIDHRPESLRWTAGMRDEWQLWRDWYGNAAASTGFVPPSAPPDAGDLSPQLAARIREAQDAVEVLRAHAIGDAGPRSHPTRDG